MAALVAIAAGSTSCTKDPNVLRTFAEVNNERGDRRLPALSWNEELTDKAQAWAERMAAANTLSHSTLTDGVSAGWSRLGENVGTGSNVASVHKGFMDSPQHRDAILNKGFTSVGVGVAEVNGRVWVAEVFEG